MTASSFGVTGTGGAGIACHPSAQKDLCCSGRSACQSLSSASSTGCNLRQSRIRATSTSTAGSASPGRFKAKRAAATSQITWPLRLYRHGFHSPSCANDSSAWYWSALSKVTTWRPSWWSCARNSAATPSRSTTTRSTATWPIACSKQWSICGKPMVKC